MPAVLSGYFLSSLTITTLVVFFESPFDDYNFYMFKLVITSCLLCDAPESVLFQV